MTYGSEILGNYYSGKRACDGWHGRVGAQLFAQVQCASCHTPVMFTGPNPVTALANKPVPLFSDLLLHDMGSLGDGIAQVGAGPREMRTAPPVRR
jgi:CxxC motif-containing protein (DUF1111 family)